MSSRNLVQFYYNPFPIVIQEWEELVATQPDGSLKRFRRRIVVVKFIKGGEDDDADTDDGEKKRPVIEQEEPIECEEVEVDENSPDFDKLFEDPVRTINHAFRFSSFRIFRS